MDSQRPGDDLIKAKISEIKKVASIVVRTQQIKLTGCRPMDYGSGQKNGPSKGQAEDGQRKLRVRQPHVRWHKVKKIRVRGRLKKSLPYGETVASEVPA